MKLKVFQGFYLFVLLFVTIKPCCTVVKKCVYLSTVWEQAQHLWCSLITCGASAGWSFMSGKCGVIFPSTKWSSALSFAVSCMLGCSSHWEVNALFQLLKWKPCTVCEEWLLSEQILCKGSTEHCCQTCCSHGLWAVSIPVEGEVWKISLVRM